jgi:hypothetical protein
VKTTRIGKHTLVLTQRSGTAKDPLEVIVTISCRAKEL